MKIYDVIGEITENDQTCQKWFVKFHAIFFCLLNNTPMLSRLTEVDCDQIKTLLEKYLYYMVLEITKIIKISKTNSEKPSALSVYLC